MNNSSKISVVITCYNYGGYLPCALDSVLSQTYGNYEIILVNDGSTDNTDEVVKPYLSNPKIKYIRQANAGQANAKNTGIKHATGEYVAFLDADDIWDETKLEKQVLLFSDLHIAVVYSNTKYIDENGQALADVMNTMKKHRGNILKKILLDNFIPFSSSIIRRSVLSEFNGFDETLKMSIDWDLWLRISTKYEFDYIDEALLIYRVGHSGQMSKNYTVRQECCDRISENFINKYSGLLTKQDIRRAKIYTYNMRGYNYRKIDPSKSIEYYCKSLKKDFFQFQPIKGIVISLLFLFFYKSK
jgi:glycosyltransferase involved in cell wall biosynthesis